MKTSDLRILAFASCLACACAEGYDQTGFATLDSPVLAPPSGGMRGAGTGGAGASSSMGGVGGVSTAPGDPCTQNDVAPCPCEGTSMPGERVCVFDMTSPTQGFFSDCQGCTPAAVPSCSDDMQNGAETGIDCGGTDCAPCPAPTSGGSGGMSGSGGRSGSGGTSGSSGMAGSSGMSGSDAGPGEDPEPVDDCDGVAEGTECDRACILPSNTARCNEDEECSCL